MERHALVVGYDVLGKLWYSDFCQWGVACKELLVPEGAPGGIITMRRECGMPWSRLLCLCSCFLVAALLVGCPPAPTPTLPVVSVDSTSYSVGESAGNVTIGVVLNKAPEAGKAVSVNYATSNGTATAGVDYTAASGGITFRRERLSRLPSRTTLPMSRTRPSAWRFQALRTGPSALHRPR